MLRVLLPMREGGVPIDIRVGAYSFTWDPNHSTTKGHVRQRINNDCLPEPGVEPGSPQSLANALPNELPWNTYTLYM